MPRALLLLALACQLVFSGAYALHTPAFEGPDENGHFAYAQHIAQASSLPIARGHSQELGAHLLDEADMACHPPLYYLVLAATLRVTGRADTIQAPRTDPRNQEPGAPMVFLHGHDEVPPRSNAITTLLILRAWSVLFGAVSIVLLYRLARRVLPSHPNLAGWAALTLACLPMWSFVHGVLNTDSLAAMLSLAGLLALVRWTQQPSPTTALACGLGLILGLGLSTKLTGAYLFVLTSLSWLYRYMRSPAERPMLHRHALSIAAMSLLAAGWWILRNTVLYGDPLGLIIHGETFDVTRVPDGMQWTWLRHGFWPQFLPSLLGNFGWFRVPPAAWLRATGLLLALAALAGLGLACWRQRRRNPQPETDAVLERDDSLHCWSLRCWGLLLGTVVLVSGLALRFNLEFRQPQGRLLFPAIGVLAIFGVLGWSTLGSALTGWQGRTRRTRAVVTTLLAALPPSLAGVVFSTSFAPAFEALPSPQASAYTAALSGDIAVDPDDVGSADWTWRGLEGASHTWETPPPLFQLEGANAADGPLSLYVWDAAGRVWLATWEWAELPLTPAAGFEFPAAGWALLPDDRELFARVRSVPNHQRGDRAADAPSSTVLRFRKATPR